MRANRSTTFPVGDPAPRRRNRTFQAGGCPAWPVLKTGRTRPRSPVVTGVRKRGERQRERRLRRPNSIATLSVGLAATRVLTSSSSWSGYATTATPAWLRLSESSEQRPEFRPEVVAALVEGAVKNRRRNRSLWADGSSAGAPTAASRTVEWSPRESSAPRRPDRESGRHEVRGFRPKAGPRPPCAESHLCVGSHALVFQPVPGCRWPAQVTA